MRLCAGLVLATLSVAVLPEVGFAEVPPNVKALLVPIEQTGMGDQAAQLSQAIEASPALSARLSGLVAAHKLTSIQVRAAAQGPFGGFLEGGAMVFTVPFLQAQVKKRLFDLVRDGDILPDNLVFCLGHLAYHLEAGAVKASDAANPLDFAMKRIAVEAAAYIQGWDDTVDAATQINGKPLDVGQVGQMLMNLRYRFAFAKAVRQTDKPEIASSGRIELTQANINAITEALKTSPIADLE